eukprot:11056289-Alexandrium_andersonii.AAC.1
MHDCLLARSLAARSDTDACMLSTCPPPPNPLKQLPLVVVASSCHGFAALLPHRCPHAVSACSLSPQLSVQRTRVIPLALARPVCVNALEVCPCRAAVRVVSTRIAQHKMHASGRRHTQHACSRAVCQVHER